jgi:hypothetical protein
VNTSGSGMTVRSTKACVVYDKETGRVCHVHRVVTFEGGREPDDDEIAANVFLSFHRLHADRQGAFEILQVDPAAIEPGNKYRVDLQTKALIQS